jgi:hypothetical protein
MPCLGKIRSAVGTLLVLMAMCAGVARASATLLLEEPYGKLGFFTATGHAAVYLSGVCAETPVVLRSCAPGESGVVISRYDGVAGYDWVAVPLIPYLYAVEKAQDIPLFVDAKTVSFLRDQYRRKAYKALAPDTAEGQAPGGNWYELVGTSYDRATYAFEIETNAVQDEAFIQAYNAAPNESHFHLVSRNCADFARNVINFYYPKALHRSLIADAGITTPKQMAKTLIKYSERHPELKFSRFVIPQIPGSMARSTSVHGVVESFLKSKKYIVPSVVLSPVFAGCVAAVYVGTGAGHFDPAQHALIYNAERGLEAPLGAEDRRAYQLELRHLLAAPPPSSASLASPASETNRAAVEKWGRLFRNTTPDLDDERRPMLRIHNGEEVVELGIANSNLFANDASSSLIRQLLVARLHAELRRGGTPKVSESDVARDWKLLQQARQTSDTEVAEGNLRSFQSDYPVRPIGNR